MFLYSQWETSRNHVNIAKAAIEHAKKNNNNVVILGYSRSSSHVDEDMMDELVGDQEITCRTYIRLVLVVDAMTGQDAVNVAKDI